MRRMMGNDEEQVGDDKKDEEGKDRDKDDGMIRNIRMVLRMKKRNIWTKMRMRPASEVSYVYSSLCPGQ